ncbi:hypothetical protein BDV25DRAFT_171472 [Aspergillus avenaceus]|uniref:Uncharacterized protein n=1 Tax=Aspergillus avenaceus TaxID=36643 RepID=A0A5N6TYJ4_ASPAV|nr:hypothetical protein BDV25DRAFT_171472 [Aspergillus avenaceus]
MDRLPNEILAKIISYLVGNISPSILSGPLPDWYPTKLAQYSIVSRRWQASVERAIWDQITLNCSNSHSIKDLVRLTSGSVERHARVGYIRRILFRPDTSCQWPEVDALSDTSSTDENELQAKVLPRKHARQCLRELKELFKLLHFWRSQNYHISLSIWAPDGEFLDIRENEDLSNHFIASLNTQQLLQYGQIPHWVAFDHGDVGNLPTLPSIKRLKIEDIDHSTFRPSAMCHLVSLLPEVKQLSLGENGSVQGAALEGLRELRQELIEHLHLIPQSVEKFSYELEAYRELSLNPSCNAANYLSPDGLDELSIGLRNLSMRLHKLDLLFLRVNSSLFWPSPEEDIHTSTLHWPYLEDVRVRFVPPYTADGQWIVDNDPEKDWDGDPPATEDYWEYDTDYFAMRGLVKSNELDRIYSAMGHAAHRMPRLRRMEFSFRWEIGEAGANEYLKFTRSLTGQVSLCLSSQWEYNPGSDMMTAWGLNDDQAVELKNTGSIIIHQWPDGGMAED